MKRIKYDFLKFWQKWRILQRMKMKILNVKFLTGNTSFLIPLKEAENRFFNILSGLCHRTEPRIIIWGKPLGDP